MILKNVKYILSAPNKKYWLADDKKEICIVGRSNVGKSTFINKITNNKNMAKTSKTPGLTKYLNFFDVDNKFLLVDTPGYGYAKASIQKDESFAKMMDEYLSSRKNLVCVIMIIDVYNACMMAAGKYYFYIESMLIAAGIYLFLTMFFTIILRYIEKKIGAPLKQLTSSN